MVSGNEYPFEVYEHGSAYYDDSFVIIGGYGAVNSSYSYGALDSIHL